MTKPETLAAGVSQPGRLQDLRRRRRGARAARRSVSDTSVTGEAERAAMRPSATLAMANRIASRSATGIRVTMSLIRKNVDPHAAVIANSARNASSSVRDLAASIAPA